MVEILALAKVCEHSPVVNVVADGSIIITKALL